MKKINYIILIMLFASLGYSKPIAGISGNWSYGAKGQGNASLQFVPLQQVALSGNNIKSFFLNTGIFDQDRMTTNTPGFEWIKGSGHDACFTAGLSLAANVAGVLKQASCSYLGEYMPGYIDNSSGTPVPVTNAIFKIFKVSSTDNAGNNPDYANWFTMVPFGAPYDDVNHNGVYDNGIDKPGVKNSSSTLFVCLTDGFTTSHVASEGFGGGTAPLFCELHFTAWDYNTPGVEDVQFIKWVLINKGSASWDSTYMGITVDPDLGYADDDYIGCDVAANLGYVYNADNDDSGNQYGYGANPPAFGMDLLKGPVNSGTPLGMTAFDYFINPSSGGALCERDPNPDPAGAYNYLKGYKIDGTQWINPLTMTPTKYCYTGDPEANTGWTERTGSVQNCNGSTTGTVVPVNTAGDRRFVLGTGASNFRVMSNDTQSVVVAQMVARGANNYNSVTKLKQLDATVQTFYDNSVGINNVSITVPSSFALKQNYPNPFNPTTNIKFDMVKSGFVTIKIYDASGKEVAVLINNELAQVGTNEVTFDAKNMSSGIYFYTLTTGTFKDTKRMVLVK